MRNHLFRSSPVAHTLLVALATACTLLSGSVAQAQNSKAKPLAVISVSSVDQLFEDADFIGSLAGQPQISAQFAPMIKGFTPGMDHSKPIGLVVQSDGTMPSGALCLPVADAMPLLAVMKNFGVTHEDGPNGTIQIGAQGQTLFARQVDGWTYLSMMPQMLDDVPANPGELLGALTDQYDLGVRLHVQNIPEAYKQMAIGQLQAGMQAGLEQLEDESDADFAARQALVKAQLDQIQEGIEGLNELTVGLAVDGEQQRSYLDVIYTAVAGSKLAAQLAENTNLKTNFGGFYQPDAALMMTFVSKLRETDIAQMQQMFEPMRKQLQTTIQEEAGDLSDEQRTIITSATGDFIDALQATLEAGKMDGGAVLNVSPSSLAFVAGGFVAEPAKIESGLKKLVELAKQEDEEFPGIQWNSSSHAGVQFHTLSTPLPQEGDEDDENARKLFGETIDIAIGIGQDSVYFAFGRDCLAAVEEVIDASAAAPQKPAPPMEMSCSLAQIMQAAAAFADDSDQAEIAMLASMLTNEATGRDHIRMVVEMIPDGARYRFEAEEGVLRAAGMAAMAAQMEAAGAPAAF